MAVRRGVFTRLVAAALVAGAGVAAAQPQTVGLFVNGPEAQPGYTLFSPMQSRDVFLIDIGAHRIHDWRTTNTPGLMAYLTEDGTLLRAAQVLPTPAGWGGALGGGGRLEEYDWDGNRIWTLDWADSQKFQHHDFKKMPNGNVLFISWEKKTYDEAVDAGRDPALTAAQGFWPDTIIEIQPTPPSGGVVVWEWHAWDHYVQDRDRRLPNYGVVADHPELLDLNTRTEDGLSDNNHLNSVDYNPQLDQVLLSSRSFSEIWIIDHSTTTAEAASHSGGRSGMGGDILYRWGNPEKYGRGAATDAMTFTQHDAQWIPEGHPGAGNILIFNNGIQRPDGTSWSEIQEIVPPLNAGGTYDISPGAPFGPAAPTWTYVGTPASSFLSPIIAGTQRMPNGNTLICEGTTGTLFEVTPDQRIAWEYVNPVIGSGPVAQGTPVTPGPAAPAGPNAIFKVRRYFSDYPGLAGRDLTPSEVLERFVAPPPVPDGGLGTTPLRAGKLDAAGSQVRVTWDPASCPSPDYNLYYGWLPDVATTTIQGSLCALGTGGTHDWSGVPPGNLFMLMVGIGEFDIYESSWGTDSFGRERNGWIASNECSVTTKSLAAGCP